MLGRGIKLCRLRARQRPSINNVAILTRGFSSAGGLPLVYPEASSTQHSDLPTFLAYAKRAGWDEESNIYVGTHYEYTVAESLTRYGFFLKRIGGASDGGTDLLGTWTPPSTSQTMRVLIQCKAGKTGPHYVRELEGSFVGAPVGWRGPGVLGLLVSEKTATKGVRDALGRSRSPMGYLSCSKDGVLKQILWNQRAEEEGLEGFAVAVKRDGKMDKLVLVQNGKPLPLLDR